VLIGDRAKNRILLYRANSCFHMPYAGEIHLPEKISGLAGLSVDAEDRLWISTVKMDNYHNASVYTWAPDMW